MKPVNLNRDFDMRKTVLFYAVQHTNNGSVVRALIDANIDVNRIDNEVKTSVFYAVRQRKLRR